jgi:hypothetical protein
MNTLKWLGIFTRIMEMFARGSIPVDPARECRREPVRWGNFR